MKPNLGAMMKQAQKMQTEMARVQQELAEEHVEVSVGGGAVTAAISGDLKLQRLTIDPDAVDLEDLAILEDMVAAAVNEALRQAQELASRKMAAVTGGLNIPGLT
ncbi:MAG: YbaB/EbfC family nucleoid-associated protein [Clostridiales bacterium]|nr:YbaB/EbfC family nucleoid-associated protein [Clostridiales bacterium]